MFGFDEIYNDLLLEAKSPEEIKKILEYQFVQGKGVPQEILDRVFAIDPTKKKTYTKWVLMQWEHEKESIVSSLKNGRLAELFRYFQERANSGLNLLGMKSFESALDMLPDVDPILSKTDDENDEANDFDIVYNTSDWKIAVPHTYEADKKLGRGCRWCTAGAFGDTDSYWRRYSAEGPLWVNFDMRKSEIGPKDGKEYPYTRYQFCFEYGSKGELCDSNDDRIDLEKMDMPEHVLQFYESKNENYRYILENNDNEEKMRERYEQQRLQNAIFRKVGTHGVDLLMLQTYNDDYDITINSDHYEIYHSEDTTDSIDNTHYYADDVYDLCDGYPLVIMKESNRYYKSFNAYYENIESNRWGETRSWESSEAEFYNDEDKTCRFFYDSYERVFLFFTGPQVSDIIHFKLNDNSYSNFEDVRLINLNNAPSEYSNSKWILLKYEDKLYGLLCVDILGKSAKMIIQRDLPANSKGFQIVKNEKGFYIEGRLKNYYLTGNEEQHNFELDSYLEDNDRFFIVTYPDADMPSLKGYGLYDSQNKTLVISGATAIYETGSELKVTYNNGAQLYSLETLKPFTRLFINSSLLRGCNGYKYQDPDSGLWYFASGMDEVEHGPFLEVLEGVTFYGRVWVRRVETKDIKIYDIEKRIFYGPDNVENVARTFFYDLFEYVTTENKFYFYNGKTNKTLCEFNPSINRIEKGDSVDDGYVIYADTDGKRNILSPMKGPLLNNGMDIIECLSTDNGYLFRMQNNDKIYFMVQPNMGNFILPSSKGIDKRPIMNMKTIRNVVGVPSISFLIALDYKYYDVLYNLNNNSIDSIGKYMPRTIADENITDPQIVSKIERLFFPDKQQISETFKKIIDRMNNL